MFLRGVSKWPSIKIEPLHYRMHAAEHLSIDIFRLKTEFCDLWPRLCRTSTTIRSVNRIHPQKMYTAHVVGSKNYFTRRGDVISAAVAWGLGTITKYRTVDLFRPYIKYGLHLFLSMDTPAAGWNNRTPGGRSLILRNDKHSPWSTTDRVTNVS